MHLSFGVYIVEMYSLKKYECLENLIQDLHLFWRIIKKKF